MIQLKIQTLYKYKKKKIPPRIEEKRKYPLLAGYNV